MTGNDDQIEEGRPALPEPGPDARRHSERLCRHIADLIADTPDRKIGFAEFMQAALYAPGLGYYSAGSLKFGAQGDFTTAAEMSVYYSRCLARHCAALLATSGGGILEIGAGSGAMAATILTELSEQGTLPDRYAILEISGDLRQRQQAFLRQALPDNLFARLIWLDRLPDGPFDGVILANELLDAMPVHRLCLQGGQWYECCVGVSDGQLAPAQRLLNDERLQRALADIVRDCEPFPDGYVIEIGLAATDWLASVAAIMRQAVILVVDYGYPRREYYHPQRHNGTLFCYYRHHGHDDPLRHVGLQDITAHVDFTALASAADRCDLTVDGFTTQATFLLACGLLDMIPGETVAADPALAQQLQTLLMPGSMGETFKVMSLGRGIDTAGPGFSLRDERYRL